MIHCDILCVAGILPELLGLFADGISAHVLPTSGSNTSPVDHSRAKELPLQGGTGLDSFLSLKPTRVRIWNCFGRFRSLGGSFGAVLCPHRMYGSASHQILLI